MKRIAGSCAWVLMAGSIAFNAFAEQASQSVVFKNNNMEVKNPLTNAPQSDKSKGEYCMDLSRKIDKLKGKPQQRFTMMERYKAECELQ